MKYEIVKLEELSGNGATIYSILTEGSDQTLLEKFIEDHQSTYKTEVDEILSKLLNIGTKYGAREQWFKLKEGKPGDHVVALYDNPDKKLRVYGIRQGSCLLIMGDGGPKPKNITALQEDDKLTETNEFMRQVSNDIYEKMRDKEIRFSEDGYELEGDLTITKHDN